MVNMIVISEKIIMAGKTGTKTGADVLIGEYSVFLPPCIIQGAVMDPT
jgi:hypothetical protein